MKKMNLSLKALMISTSLLIGVSVSAPLKAVKAINDSKQAVKCTLMDNDSGKMIGRFNVPPGRSGEFGGKCSAGWGWKLVCFSQEDSAITGETFLHCVPMSRPKNCKIGDITQEGEPDLSINCL